MSWASLKFPIPRPPNPLSLLFSQLNNFFTGYSSRSTLFVPTLEVSDRGKRVVRRRKELWVESSRCPFYRKVTIGSLPDDILLEIFDFYVYLADYDRWHTLVHVCKTWRNVVFASPRRLHLRLLCMPDRPVQEMLDIWPELPIVILDFSRPKTVGNVGNIINTLGLNDRVSVIDLRVSRSDMEKFAAIMQDPFPALTYLDLGSNDETVPVISDSFLGGFAPRLQRLNLSGIPIPSLPNLLLSATDLVFLQLWDIPHSGYISPEAMVACLSVLTRLDDFSLGFRSPQSCPAKASRRPPPQTRIVLPVLTYLGFTGVPVYLEDLISQIDAPLLVIFRITFFNQLVFDLLQLPMFLRRTQTFTVLNRAGVSFDERFTNVDFSSRTDKSLLSLTISCKELDWQLSSLSQVCNSLLLALSAMRMEYLDLRPSISGAYPPLIEDDMEHTQWLELLHPFTHVKDLHLPGGVSTRIALALEELTGKRVTETLPKLQDIFIDSLDEPEPVPKGILDFVAARQLSDCAVAIRRRRLDWEGGTWVGIESNTE